MGMPNATQGKQQQKQQGLLTKQAAPSAPTAADDEEAQLDRLAHEYARDGGVEARYAGHNWREMERRREREADRDAALAAASAVRRTFLPAAVRGAASLGVRADDEDDDDDACLAPSPVAARPRAAAELGPRSSPLQSTSPGQLLADALNGASLRLLGAFGGEEEQEDDGLDALLPETPRDERVGAGEQQQQEEDGGGGKALMLQSPLDAPW